MGCIEAHGHHLPVDVDSSIAERVAEAVSETTGAFVLPVINFVYTGSTKNFPGTFGISMRTMTETIKDIVKDIYRQGFHKIFLLNGNGANMVSVQLASRELLDELEKVGLKLAFASWWDSGVIVPHAGQKETEMYIAACGKEVVRWDKIKDGTIPYPKGFRTNDWTRWAPNDAGVNGEPSKAKPENSGKLFAESVNFICELVDDLKSAGWLSAVTNPTTYLTSASLTG